MDLISDARRPDIVHDQADDTDAPAGGVPLRLGSRRATAQYDIWKPTRTNCAIGGAAAKLRRFGSGLGFVGSPVDHTTGDFLLALGLRCPCRLERRFKLQPQLPGLRLGRRGGS